MPMKLLVFNCLELRVRVYRYSEIARENGINLRFYRSGRA